MSVQTGWEHWPMANDEVTDWTPVALAADEAAAVAVWAYMERERTPATILTWARRRFLDRVFREKAAEHDRLTGALEAARSSPAWEEMPPPRDPGIET